MITLSPLFHALADLFAEGDKSIAQTAVAALRKHAESKYEPAAATLSTHGGISALLDEPDAHLCAKAIAPIMDTLAWYHPGLRDGRIANPVASRLQVVELIGDRGMVDDTTCRIGLFAQTANIDYLIHTHAAEELFVQIAGRAEWMQSGRPYTEGGPGARMHHASYEPHASRTANSAMIAAWVWTGDLDYNTYRYRG